MAELREEELESRIRETHTAENDTDPFSPNNAPGLSLIVLMRLYDVQMALLSVTAPDKAAALHEAHLAGQVVGAPPAFAMPDEEA